VMHEWIVESGVKAAAGGRAIRSADAFDIGAPGNARVAELRHEMIGRGQDMRAGIAAVSDAVVGARFEPEVIWQTAWQPRRRVILVAIRRHRQEGVNEERGRTDVGAEGGP